MAVSITKAEFHWELLFVVFETGKIAVFPKDLAMPGLQYQMCCGDRCGGDNQVLNALLNPWS
jgi:hypothetical protein